MERTSLLFFEILLLSFFILFISPSSSSCPTATTRWSQWSNAPTSPGSNVEIAATDSILMDVSPVTMNTLTVKGKLVISDDKNITIRLGLLFIQGGHLWAGSEDCPHLSSLSFILVGNPPSLAPPSNKAISVSGGSLNLHGIKSTSWTNLTRSANKGDSYILVNAMKNWKVGDTLIIAPTAFFVEEMEIKTIAAINGNNITLNTSLEYYHHSDFYHGVNGERVEMRAEVALLERNIVVRGDENSEATQFGATVMCYNSAMCKFSNVLFRECGHEMVRGRYAVHFHNLGDIHGGWAKSNIVYNSFNRAYVVHSTNHTRIEDNVAINVKGHTYFIEDGNEFFNDFIGNLAINTLKMKDDLTGGDKDQPSSFWITNPVNTFIGNHAVGSVFGYWFAMPFNPIGLGINLKDMFPMFLPLLTFDDNVAHTIRGDGLFVDRGVRPDNMAPDGTFYRPSRFDYLKDHPNKGDRIGTDSEPGITYFTRYLGYKCNGMGAWMRGYNMEFHYSSFIDNGVGIEFAGGNNRLVHGFVVGLSDNWGTNRPFDFVDYTIYGYSWYEAVGFHFYHGGGPTHVVQTTFQNFADRTLEGEDYFGNKRIRKGWAIKTDTGGTAYPSHDRFYNCTFHNVSHNVWFNSQHEPGQKSQCELSPVIIDMDGSISGTCGNWLVGPYNPLMITNECKSNPSLNGYVCPPNHSPIRMFEVIEGGGDGGIITRLHDKAQLPLSQYDWSVHLVANADYFLKIGKGVQLESSSPNSLAFQAPLMHTGEYINLVIPYKPGSNVIRVCGTDCKIQFTPTNSKANLNGFNYYWDSSAGLMHVRYATPADTFQYQRDQVFSLNSWSVYTGHKWIVKIEMDCGGPCAHTVNPATISGAYNPKASKFTTCGDLLAGGLPKWSSDSSVSSYSIFDGEMKNGWTATGSVSIVANNISVPAPGGVNKLIRGSYPFYLKPTTTMDVTSYTHLAMDVLIDKNEGDRTRACIVINSRNISNDRPLLGTDTDMCNPFYTPFPPFDIWEWRTVYVPLSDIRKPTDPARIDQLEINTGGQYPYRPTAWYLANIKLVKGTNKIESAGNNKWMIGRGGDPDPMPWVSPLINSNSFQTGNRTYATSPIYRLGPSSAGCFWPEMLSGNCYLATPNPSSTSQSSTSPSQSTTSPATTSTATVDSQSSPSLSMNLVAIFGVVLLLVLL